MEEKIIEIAELERKFTGFASVPKGDEDTAYVFFQSKDNNKYAISTEKRKIMATELRIGKYDRIMTIYRGEFTEFYEKEIACEEEGHYFYIQITIKYYIADPEKIYLDHIYQPADEIEKCLANIEFELAEKYSFMSRHELKKELNKQVENNLKALSYLRCTFQLNVDVDESATTIIKRIQEHDITKTKADLSTIEEMTDLDNKHQLEQAKLDYERSIAELQAQIESLKVDHLGDLIRQYGSNAGNMIDHVSGKLTGAALAESINKTTKENRDNMIDTIIRLKNENIINSDTAANASVAALGLGTVGMLETKDSKEEEVQQEQERFKWNSSNTQDGDME